MKIWPAPIQPAPYRIAQDDVLDVELVNALGSNGVRIVDGINSEHVARGSKAGDHNLLPLPIAARLDDFKNGSHRRGNNPPPVWAYGPWTDDTYWSGQWLRAEVSEQYQVHLWRVAVSDRSPAWERVYVSPLGKNRAEIRCDIGFREGQRVLVLAYGVRR